MSFESSSYSSTTVEQTGKPKVSETHSTYVDSSGEKSEIHVRKIGDLTSVRKITADGHVEDSVTCSNKAAFEKYWSDLVLTGDASGIEDDHEVRVAMDNYQQAGRIAAKAANAIAEAKEKAREAGKAAAAVGAVVSEDAGKVAMQQEALHEADREARINWKAAATEALAREAYERAGRIAAKAAVAMVSAREDYERSFGIAAQVANMIKRAKANKKVVQEEAAEIGAEVEQDVALACDRQDAKRESARMARIAWKAAATEAVAHDDYERAGRIAAKAARVAAEARAKAREAGEEAAHAAAETMKARVDYERAGRIAAKAARTMAKAKQTYDTAAKITAAIGREFWVERE
eukprot:INCI6358.1.p2 GENE.INCI6358.1~~INCI6358.1.p2  ORF type:complete len:349 (+),score=101.60 INCI6358.1:241-1287(+)